MNIGKITEKLEQYPLLEMAIHSRFIKTSVYKISPLAFVLSFFEMVLSGNNTLELWASKIARYTGHLISVQALQNRLQYPQVDFCVSLLKATLDKQLRVSSPSWRCGKLMQGFGRVHLEDSTCITLPKFLYPFFPGSVNQKGHSSSARIQLRLELKSGRYESIELQGYRDNDQKHASHIINQVECGDLVIRDLGYYVIEVFKRLNDKGVFFLSRFGFNSGLYDKESGQTVDLAKKLRKLRRQGISTWDEQVLLGSEHKVPVRIIAIKAPQQVEQQRKRKVNRDRRAKRSKEYMELLGWTIFITNIEQDVWTAQDVLQLYGYRWRIEIIFKCWKRHFDFGSILKRKNSLSHPRVLITFYLILIATTLLFTNCYSIAMLAVHRKTGKILSFLKFGNYLKQVNCDFDPEQIDATQIQILARYFSQTKRKQVSQMELLYNLNSS